MHEAEVLAFMHDWAVTWGAVVILSGEPMSDRHEEQRLMTDRGDEPQPSRPDLPAAYGVPTSSEGLLPWSHAAERLARARHYWIGTTAPEGTPHAVPVWGVWAEGRLFFGLDPRTRTARNLARNPAAVVHLESGAEVVIVKGVVERVSDPALLKRSATIGAAKYGTSEPRDDTASAEGAGQPVYALRPRTAYAWSAFPTDMTRWRFSVG